MTHASFIIAAYTIALGLPLIMGLMTATRLASARNKLAALETRPRSARRSGQNT
ncbi:Hypothetical protein GbCGDNIH3_7192 [Granulibacter bethesdensis]|uniref:Heme exporter protein D n=1 Tax=Granulibacter bethesdensis TaxID=364410 RepID=A0AAN0RBW6_9PROT|nr:hypothetical protein [Granulibacter bethesdensis]AHJ62027.1 Hypothetical protein GbCGDNIH3_7192 [Granulibacter bethesdensis]AHJ64647.1 Hypothetical protein GbCGDNIH4_7092 [Granulibacter bethesdensis CGDNIH4]